MILYYQKQRRPILVLDSNSRSLAWRAADLAEFLADQTFHDNLVDFIASRLAGESRSKCFGEVTHEAHLHPRGTDAARPQS